MKIQWLLLLTLFPLSLLADGGLPTQPYIYVRGTADIEKAPDMVVLRFDLVARAPEQAKANTDVQARAAKVFSLLAERKIEKKDIIAEQLSSEATFDQNETNPRERKLIGYIATRPMSVDVHDINAFPKLVDDLISDANAEFRATEPVYSKADELREQLWEKAIADARVQAESTAKQAGMKIESVYAISPVSIPDISSTMFPKDDTERVVVTGSYIPAAGERAKSEYRLAPIHFNQTVHVIYLMTSLSVAK